MRDTLLYLLLFTYSASILKPAMPYLSDTIAHTFYHSEHIKTVHFENGKYHVHHELVKQTQRNTTNKNSDYIKKCSQPDEHLTTTESTVAGNPSFSTNYSVLILHSLLPVCRNAVFSPPRWLYRAA